jgi:hypothetical protein
LYVDRVAGQLHLVKDEGINFAAHIGAERAYADRYRVGALLSNANRRNDQFAGTFRLQSDLIVHPALGLTVDETVLAACVDAQNVKIAL